MIDTTANMLAGAPAYQPIGGSMTLEMAIRDWQERLDKQAAEIERLRAQRDAWRTLVLDHNAECKKLCHEEACIVIDSYSGCVNCPDAHSIDIPPELEPKP